MGYPHIKYRKKLVSEPNRPYLLTTINDLQRPYRHILCFHFSRRFGITMALYALNGFTHLTKDLRGRGEKHLIVAAFADQCLYVGLLFVLRFHAGGPSGGVGN